jgi:cell division protease FtsH
VHDVVVTGRIESTFLRDLLSWVIPMALFAGVWMFLIRRVGGSDGGLLQIGKSKAKVYVETDIKITFDDVAGVDEAKAELQEIVDFLKNPQEYGRLGGRMPKGVLREFGSVRRNEDMRIHAPAPQWNWKL